MAAGDTTTDSGIGGGGGGESGGCRTANAREQIAAAAATTTVLRKERWAAGNGWASARARPRSVGLVLEDRGPDRRRRRRKRMEHPGESSQIASMIPVVET